MSLRPCAIRRYPEEEILPPGGGRPPIPAFTMWGHSYTHSPVAAIAGTFDFKRPWYLGGSINQFSPWRIDRILASMLGLEEDKVRHLGVGGAVLLSDQRLAYPIPGLAPGQKRYGWGWILQQTCRGPLNRYGWAPQRGPSGGNSHMDSQFGPFMPSNTAHVLLYGTNDIGYFGDPGATVDGVPGMIGTAWTEANRSVISRLRCGGIVENDLIYNASTQPYGVTYGGSWTTAATTAANSGVSVTTLASGSGTITLHLAADWPGGTVTFRFRGMPATGGTVTIPGVPTFSLAHRMPETFTSITRAIEVAGLPSTAYQTIPAWVPSYGTVARRVPVARTGVAQTIVVSVSAAAGSVVFDCVDLEQAHMAPPVVVGNTPLPARWNTAYTTTPRWAAYPDDATNCNSGVAGRDTSGSLRGTQVTEDGDAWSVTENSLLDAVVAEFAELAPDGTAMNSTVVADLYTACDGILHPEFYKPQDALHPNPAGTAAMAAAFYQAFTIATAHPLTAAALGSP